MCNRQAVRSFFRGDCTGPSRLRRLYLSNVLEEGRWLEWQGKSLCQSRPLLILLTDHIHLGLTIVTKPLMPWQ